MTDMVNHPPHYKKYHVECIEITEHLSFCLGNCVKYIYRAGEKGDAIEDIKKALWYLKRAVYNGESTKEHKLAFSRLAVLRNEMLNDTDSKKFLKLMGMNCIGFNIKTHGDFWQLHPDALSDLTRVYATEQEREYAYRTWGSVTFHTDAHNASAAERYKVLAENGAGISTSLKVHLFNLLLSTTKKKSLAHVGFDIITAFERSLQIMSEIIKLGNKELTND